MDRYTLLKLVLAPWIFLWGLGFFVVINLGNGDGWSMGEGAFIENRVLAILVTSCCCYLALNVWFVLIPKWRGEKEPSANRKTNKEKKAIRRAQSATRRKLKGYESLVLYESPELEEVINDINLHLRTFGHYVMFIQIYMAGVDGKVTRDETETLEVHKDELIQGMINAGAASEWTAESYLDEAISDARSLYNKYQQTGKLDIGYAVCIRRLTTLAQGIGNWSGPPGTRPAGPHLKAAYSFLNDVAFADGDLDYEESEALQFADSEWSSVPGYAQYNPYQ